MGRAIVEEALRRGHEIATSTRARPAWTWRASRRCMATWNATQDGTYKARCERAVVEIFGDRALVLHLGVILGLHENVGRLTGGVSRIVIVVASALPLICAITAVSG
jgi:hypothetical protein